MNVEDIWSEMASPTDMEVTKAAGYGASAGLGEKPALLVVDAVESVVGPKGVPTLQAIRQYRTSCGERAWEAVPVINRVLAHARGTGIPVIFTHARHRTSVVDLGRRGGKNSRASEELQKWAANANEIIAELRPLPGELVLEKDKPSAFFGTPLISLLTVLGIDTVLVTGATTSGCVRATVLDAYSYNLYVGVVADAVFDRWHLSHCAALFDMQMRFGDVIDASAACVYLTSTTSAGARGSSAVRS